MRLHLWICKAWKFYIGTGGFENSEKREKYIKTSENCTGRGMLATTHAKLTQSKVRTGRKAKFEEVMM